MNTSPRTDVKGAKTLITCMTMQANQNKLEKGQKTGDATKAISKGKIEVVGIQMPIVEMQVSTHEVNPEGFRILPNGEIERTKINKKDREMQLARIAEQEGKKTSKDSER